MNPQFTLSNIFVEKLRTLHNKIYNIINNEEKHNVSKISFIMSEKKKTRMCIKFDPTLLAATLAINVFPRPSDPCSKNPISKSTPYF